MLFRDIYECICNYFELCCLADILYLTCLDKTILRQFEDVLKMSCVHWVADVSSKIWQFWLFFDWLVVQRLDVLKNVVDMIFDTITTTLINFVLWEILIFVDTIQISQKFQLHLVIPSVSYHCYSSIEPNLFSMISETT